MKNSRYVCEKCNYNSNNKTNYNKHCKTKKHINTELKSKQEILIDSKYKKGKIYVIKSIETNKVYIGSTCKDNIIDRLHEHKRDYINYLRGINKSYVTSFKLMMHPDNYIELVESCPCNNNHELLKKEGYHISNTPNCINKYVVGKCTNKFICEYCKCPRDKKHKARHYKKCKAKKDTEISLEIKELKELTSQLKELTIQLKKELKKKDEKMDDIEKGMFEFMKTINKQISKDVLLKNNIPN